MTDIKPIGKYIAIKDSNEEVESGGLLLTGEAVKKLRYKKGVVIKPGTEVKVIKEGDTVYYDKGQSFTMMIENQAITLIKEQDIIIVV
jgi:co-chaperonin GroES (HSP10)